MTLCGERISEENDEVFAATVFHFVPEKASDRAYTAASHQGAAEMFLLHVAEHP